MEEQKIPHQESFLSPQEALTLLKALSLFQNMKSFPFHELITTAASFTDVLFSIFCEEQLILPLVQENIKKSELYDLIIYLCEASRTHNRLCNAHFLHNIETKFSDVIYLCFLFEQVEALSSLLFFKQKRVIDFCNTQNILYQKSLKRHMKEVVQTLEKERLVLLESTEEKLEGIRIVMKTYKENEIKKDVKGEEADYVYFKKAKVGLDLLTEQQWKTQFEWIGGAYQHNVNMDLRIGTNRLQADFKEDHLELCKEDFDADMKQQFIIPAFNTLKQRKLPILKKLIGLSQKQNTHKKSGTQYEAVKYWILSFGLRASVCATEVIYGVASIFSGIEKEQKPKNVELISIYKNFDDWVKQISKLRPDITSQRSVHKNFQKSQKSAQFGAIQSTINPNLEDRIILKNSRINRAVQKQEKKEFPYYFQHHLLRTWQADQRRLGAWRRISPLDHQEISELRTVLHFCYCPLMFDQVEMLFNFKITQNEEKLYAIDTSGINDAKVRLEAGKKYRLSDGDVIEAVTFSNGQEIKFLKLEVSIFKKTQASKDAVDFRELEKELPNLDSYYQVYGLTEYGVQKGEDEKFETSETNIFGPDDFKQLSDQHFMIEILEEGKNEDDDEEDEEEEAKCVVLVPSENKEKATYIYFKKKEEMSNAEASSSCSSIKNHQITLQNRVNRAWQTSFKLQ